MRVSEIRVKQIRVNQGLGAFVFSPHPFLSFFDTKKLVVQAWSIFSKQLKKIGKKNIFQE